MIILSTAILLIFVSLIIIGIRMFRPGYPHLWLISVTTLIIVWIVLCVTGWMYLDEVPTIIPLFTWQPDFLFPTSPSLYIDHLSWIFIVSVVTVALAATLTDIGRPLETQETSSYRGGASVLLLTALAMFSTMADNLLTLIIVWTVLDFSELLLWMSKSDEQKVINRIVIIFSSRIAGIIVVIAAGMIAIASGSSHGFNTSNTDIGILLLIAVGIRLGVTPPISQIIQMKPAGGLDVALRLIPISASLALLPRISISASSPFLANFIFIFTMITLIYAGTSWFSAQDSTNGAPYWIMGLSALAIISALFGYPLTSQAWAISGILPGGMIFLYHSHHRRLLPIFLITSIGLVMFPYTPTWPGLSLYSSLSGITLFLLTFQSVLIAGFLRHSINPLPILVSAERWVWLVYPAGLTVIFITFFLLGIWTFIIEIPSIEITLPIQDVMNLWPSLLSGLIITLFIILRRRGPIIPVVIVETVKRISSLEWFYGIIRWLFILMSEIVYWIRILLEGQAGILWSLLILVLLISVISQLVSRGIP